jgi:hypothetical protein
METEILFIDIGTESKCHLPSSPVFTSVPTPS